MEPIRVEHVYKSFSENAVLSDFSAEFPAGTFTAVMGRSGGGKTTLLNLILGFLTPDEGRITGVPEKIAAVFQEDRLCEDFSVRTNIRMAVPGDVTEDEILTVLRKLRMEEAAEQKVKELSGGMKRRVAIARAVLAKSDLLILDEPLKGLDEDTKKEAMKLLKKEKKTVIMVTHDRAEAEALGDRILTVGA